jgi:zinc protease
MGGVAFAGLSPERVLLDSGAVVLAKHVRTTPAVTINLSFRAGSVCDPIDAPGAMYLLSRVIDRGTATRGADAIAEELDSRGIALSLSVTRHLFTVACTCLAEDFAPVFALLADIVRAPSFPDAEIAKRKGEVITAIRQDEDNPAVRATESMMALLYPDGHPYGRRTKGSVETVESLTRSRLADLHARWFAPASLSVVVVGDVPAGAAVEAAGRVFADWRMPAPEPVPLPRVANVIERRRLVIPMMNKAQADVAYGLVAIARDDPDYYACWLMNNALGQYALGGRLGDSIRERQGMAYYVFSSLDANVIEGPFVVRAGVAAADVDRAIASIDEELRHVARSGLSAKELNDSRQYLIASMPRALETNAGIATFLQSEEFFRLGLDYDQRLPGLFNAVTLDQVHHVANRLLDPDRATVVIAGPYEAG